MRWTFSSFVLMAFAAFTVSGCGGTEESSVKNTAAIGPVVDIDDDGMFEKILGAVEKVAGKSFQKMQMGGMTSATYQYGEPIDKVVAAIDPIAKEAGFAPIDDDKTNEGYAKGQEHVKGMMNMDMKMLGSKMYGHENGNMLTIMRMDVSTQTKEMQMDMQMLTIQLMNPGKMAETGSQVTPAKTP